MPSSAVAGGLLISGRFGQQSTHDKGKKNSEDLLCHVILQKCNIWRFGKYRESWKRRKRTGIIRFDMANAAESFELDCFENEKEKVSHYFQWRPISIYRPPPCCSLCVMVNDRRGYAMQITEIWCPLSKISTNVICRVAVAIQNQSGVGGKQFNSDTVVPRSLALEM